MIVDVVYLCNGVNELKAKFLTDRGQVRDFNEDSGGIFYNQKNQLLAIIADGMGGHQAGDIASKMAVDLLQSQWQKVDCISSPEEAEGWIESILKKINEKLFNESLEKDEYKGMGTTAVLAICAEDFVSIGHIGDSRCYLRNDNGFKQLTEDHSLVNELVKTGQISTEDAEHHPRKNIVLKALGTEEEIHADIKSLSWEKNNRLLLCSDGLTDKISNDELEVYINSKDDLARIGSDLIELANKRGGEDNISLIIVDSNLSKEGDSTC